MIAAQLNSRSTKPEKKEGAAAHAISLEGDREEGANLRMSTQPVDSMLGKMGDVGPTFHVAAAIVAWPLVDGWK